MTKEEIVEKYEHTFAGMVLDSWSQNRTGEAQVLFARRINPHVKEMLGRLFDEAIRSAQEDAAKFQSSGSKSNGMFGEETPSKTKKGRNNDVE